MVFSGTAVAGDTVTINDIVLDAYDRVGAFNGDICVGAQQWDISLCGSGGCSINIMGNLKAFY